jgi:alpha-maltose-1-phosphate synthase
MQVLLAHPGTQHAPRLAAELAKRDRLSGFWTGLAFTEGGVGARLARALPRWTGLSQLATRTVQDVPSHRLHTMPLLEARALARRRMGADEQTVWCWRNEVFQNRIPTTALVAADAVIGFDTSGWILADRCRKLDRPFYLDRTIAHPAAFARILRTCAERFPAWVATAPARSSRLTEAEAQEHALAHRIVVGGAFARDTLIEAGIDAARIRVNAYGVDWSTFAPSATPVAEAPRPLRFLFAGTVCARKGVPVLLEAWRKLAPKNAELWLAGRVGERERPLIPVLRGLKVLGQIPRAQIPALYAQADVFVLPSFFEGLALVQLEAIAAGLPIITTPNAGGLDFLPHPVLGHVVEPGSVDALAAALEWWCAHPPRRDVVLAAAQPLAARFTWSAYADRWMQILDEG